MSFSGFSEDDIRKLNKTQENTKKGSNKTLKKVTFKPNHTLTTSKNKNISNHVNNKVRIQEMPENAKLSVVNKAENDAKDVSLNQANTTESNQVEKEETLHVPKDEDQENVIKNEKKFKDLDEFEARQKLIEEQNRKRKELLAKALADRTKQTREEAQRLGEIQVELEKLDAVLSVDVKILRKEIELASIEYMECQKRYKKIEKEFLEAKVLLHQKQEKKEMLTEHLCTIIEKNEERKAEKLMELLRKLQLPAPENDVDVLENGNGQS